MIFLVFKNFKPFFDVDGPFLCLQNCENSPQKNSITSIFILMFSKKLDKV
jgi:hypothetical protein